MSSSLPACRAPFTSMYLTPRGDVQACCFNLTHTLGNVRERRLSDIWWGEEAEQLRAAVQAHDLSLGCQFCAWQMDEGNQPPSDVYEELDLGAGPAWPKRMELALSNRCNLECVMCHGELSSSIRLRREGLPALAGAYDQRFFDELEEFIPHLDQLMFLGGEPMLAPETATVLRSVIRLGAPVHCHITTNGSVITPVMAELMEQHPLSFAVSVDGVSPAMVEDIRRGVDHGRLLANIERLRAYCAGAGTTLDLTFSIMRRNWHELPDLLVFAEERQMKVWTNLVASPYEASLFSLPPAELDPVVDALEGRDEEMLAALTLNRAVWSDELDRLRSHRGRQHGARRSFATLRIRTGAGGAGEPSEASSRMSPSAHEPLPSGGAPSGAEAVDELECGAAETVLASSGATFLGVPADLCVGRPVLQAVHRVESALRASAHVVSETSGPAGSSHRLVFDDLGSGRRVAVAEVAVVPLLDADGRTTGTRWRAHWAEPPAAGRISPDGRRRSG